MPYPAPSSLHIPPWRAVLFACVVLSGSAWAQVTDPIPAKKPVDPPELTQMRQQFTLRALGISRLLADQYTNALAALETQAADAADYETALGAQRRRSELTTLYAAASSDSYVLRPADAKTVGAVSLDKNENALVNWRSAGSSASWDINKLTPGTYIVTMTCGVADSGSSFLAPVLVGGSSDTRTGGEVEFSEVTSLSGGDTAKLTGPVRTTGGWTSYATITLGSVKLSRTSARVSLKATRLEGGGGLMHLKEVRLTPERAAPAVADESAAEEFANARTEHAAKLLALKKPLADDYLAKLKTLRADLHAKDEADARQQITSEMERVKEVVSDEGISVRTTPRASFRGEGFEEIAGAKFVDSATNTADRFLVTADGTQFSVRLLFVTSPPPQPEDKALHEKMAAYFGISPEDSVAAGRQAQEFAATFLKDRALKIFRRGPKDAEGSFPAIVQTTDAGDYAGVLVDNGLAIINEAAAKVPAQRRSEDGVLSALRQREASARAKAVPPGSWLFADTPSPAK